MDNYLMVSGQQSANGGQQSAQIRTADSISYKRFINVDKYVDKMWIRYDSCFKEIGV